MSQDHGKVWWTELMTRDVPGALAYYKAVCSWYFEPMPMGAGVYQVGFRAGQPVVGVMDLGDLPGMEDVPPHWFSYFAVSDLPRALEQTRAQGGGVIREPFRIEGVGQIAILRDPTGAALGLMTPARMG
ncbi:VOC family protein [Rhodovulum tesquicola]|uniref:VOC family protein n=1 Tax=Rhodovulum tesquicola TaxID=540254 RepID=UPI002097F092|nr:VOC family protein [Rhodovulum tesquicola]MCO8145158.1 VOC family protein [Rhodovulum tesquicola]